MFQINSVGNSSATAWRHIGRNGIEMLSQPQSGDIPVEETFKACKAPGKELLKH
jgi:hypothetical protein